MNLKLRHVDGPGESPVESGVRAASAASPAAAPLTIDGWLGVFATMLPRRQAESIREELEMHLRDRVRDLMVGGLDEAESTKRAIAELGEAAELAGKYRALQSEPNRRLIMYGSIFAVAGAAVALSVTALSGGWRQPQDESVNAKEAVKAAMGEVLLGLQPSAAVDGTLVLQPQIVGKEPLTVRPRILEDVKVKLDVLTRPAGTVFQVESGAPELSQLKMDVEFDRTPAADVFKMVGERAKMPVQANWGQLTEMGLDPKTPVTLRGKGVGADVILRALNEAAGGTAREGQIDWRSANGVIEVGPREHFDRREITLVIYDLGGIIAARQEKYNEERAKIVEEVTKLVWEFVSPDGWTENGGDLAKLTVVGDRMFVEAPERFHKQIKWMLEQLPGQDAGAPKAEPQGAGPKHDWPMRVVNLGSVGAAEALTVVRQAMNVSPALRDGVDQRVNCLPDRNSIIMAAPAEQAATIEQLLKLIDVPEGEVRGGPASRKFTLEHVSPRVMREFLGKVFDVSPGLRQCAVPRVMSCDESERKFELTATPDQVETVAKLIGLVDRDAQ